MEHCPVYKYSRWESDAPRAKLAILHGMLSGELSPSQEAAERLFECFYCKRCENSCSAGIPVTEIFSDARFDLIEAGLAGEGTTVRTDAGKCVKCFVCVNVCHHEARIFRDKVITTDPVKCRGCGRCTEACSAAGITMHRDFGTSPEQMHEKIRHHLSNEADKKKVVVFACNWSSFTGMQNTRWAAEGEKNRDNIIISMCTGRIKAEVLLRILEKGADGILIAGCPEDECEHDGSKSMRKRMPELQERLRQAGIHPERIRFREVEKGNLSAFSKACGEYESLVRKNFTPTN